MQRVGLVAAAAVVLFGFVLQSLAAATERELAAGLGGGRDVAWAAAFANELSSLATSARVSPAAYGVVLRALSGGPIEGPAVPAARMVFSLCLRADEALRRGVPAGQVLLETRQSARLAEASGNPNLLRGSAQQRLQERLAGMGGQVSGDMSNRLGPQSGPGMGGAVGAPPAGLPGSSSSGAGGGSGQAKP